MFTFLPIHWMEALYFDHAAATPLRPEVLEAMGPWMKGPVGNPESIHGPGRRARRAIDHARERIAALLRADPDQVVFTRGGTESANLAILGRLEAVRDTIPARDGAPAPVFLSSAIEHSAVREAIEEAGARGVTIRKLRVDPRGQIDDDELEGALADVPALVSLQWVNQETGLVLPVERVSAVCHERGVSFHVDAVQAGGRIPIDLADSPIDLLTLSAHKMGGPRGVGALVVRDAARLRPRLFGGGQERGVRPGTGDVAGAVGFAEAFERAEEERESEGQRLGLLRDRFEEAIRGRFPDARIHAVDGPRTPHILGVGFPGVPRDILPSALDLAGIAVSAGSACRSGSTEPSPVLAALYGEVYAHESAPLRISLGWSTTAAEVERALPILVETVERVRTAGG